MIQDEIIELNKEVKKGHTSTQRTDKTLQKEIIRIETKTENTVSHPDAHASTWS